MTHSPIEVSTQRGRATSGVTVAWLIALGIGLHNLGEGLAIGSAYGLGELTLGALLVIGFTIHNENASTNPKRLQASARSVSSNARPDIS